jgi:hypothetical protein
MALLCRVSHSTGAHFDVCTGAGTSRLQLRAKGDSGIYGNITSVVLTAALITGTAAKAAC